MTTNYKILGQSAPNAGTETNLYQVPSSNSTMVKSINITNRSATSDTYSISILDDVSIVDSPLFVAVRHSFGSNGAATSTDGITWTTGTLPSSGSWKSVTYGNNTFFAVGNGTTTAATSTNGLTWTTRTMPASAQWRSVTFANNTFVAVASGSTTAATSTNGITWTLRTLPGSHSWNSVTYGNNTFVAVATQFQEYDPYAATSTDGITWTARTLPGEFRAWKSVTYGNNTFVAVPMGNTSSYGPTTTAASSTDGITWTTRTLSSSAYWSSVTYGNNTFVAVAAYLASYASSSTAATSTDGITWTTRTLPSNANWYSVTYGNDRFVAVSNYSTKAASSTNGITWTLGVLLNFEGQWQSVTSGSVPSSPTTQNKDYIAYNNTVAGNSTVSIKAGYTIPQNGGIRITSTNGTSTFSSFGAEIQ